MTAEREVQIKVKIEPHQSNIQAGQLLASTMKKAHEESARAAVESITEQRKAADAAYKAMAEAAEEFEAKQADAVAQVAGTRESMKQLLDGSLTLARGFVTIGVASEENLEKAVRTLARFQGAADVMKGLIDTTQAAVRIWDAYRASVAAAAAAQTTLNLAQEYAAVSGGKAAAASAANAATSAGARSAGGVAAGVGGAVVGGAAASAAGTTGIGATIANVATAVIAPLLALAAAAAGVGAAFLSITGKWGVFLEFIGWTDKAGDAMRDVAERNNRIADIIEEGRQRLQDQIGARNRELGENLNVAGFLAANAKGSDNRGNLIRNALAENRAQQASINTGGVDGASTQFADLRRQEAELLKQLSDLQKEKYAKERASMQEQITTAKQQIELSKQQRDTALEAIRSLQDSLKSAEVKFAEADKLTQAKVLDAKRAANSGEALNKEQRELLRTYGGADANRQADDAAVRQASPEFLGQYRANFNQAERKEIIDKRIEAIKAQVDIQASQELVVKLETDIETLTYQVGEVIQDFANQIVQKMNSAIENERTSQRTLQGLRTTGAETAAGSL